eukprot:5922462-Lingulodinium_polyedra.AAC.1
MHPPRWMGPGSALSLRAKCRMWSIGPDPVTPGSAFTLAARAPDCTWLAGSTRAASVTSAEAMRPA